MKFYAGIGSRETPQDVLHRMQRMGRTLAQLGYTLRSGGAAGADTAFEIGALAGHNMGSQIFLPWRGFGNHTSHLHTVTAEAQVMAEKYHPAWGRLSDAAKRLMARNCYQVLGLNLDDPSKFILCWTKDGKASGGTGQAIRIAEDYKIPVFNLKTDGAVKELQRFLLL